MKKSILKNFIALFVVGFVLFGFNSTVFALSDNITQINFTSDSQTIDVNTNSTVFTTQTQSVISGIDTKESVSEITTLNYTSTSDTGQFSDANISEETCNESTWSESLTLSLSSTHANKGFCYKDSTPGIYTLTVSVEGKSWTHATQEITVVDNSKIIDNTPPLITLTGEDIVNLNVGDTYTDVGATAIDDVDGDITYSIVKSGTYTDTSTSTAGTYTITYDVSDNAGNPATQVTRTVMVSEVSTPSSILSIDISVDVPATCEVSDIDNVTHAYTTNSTTSYLGICALKAALDLNSISSVRLSNKYPSMGLFITAFNNTEADPDSQYWALYQNSGYTDFGISTLPISAGDVISFKLSDFSGSETDDTVVIRVKSLIINDSIDTTIPIITLNGDADVSLDVNDTYTDVGATAIDDVDGDITYSIVKSGTYTDTSTSTAGTYTITYDVSDNAGNPATQVTRIVTVTKKVSGGGGGSNSQILHHKVDTDEALRYLSEKQNSDGSFSSDLYTDWVAIAAGAGSNSNLKSKIVTYLKENSLDSDIATDNERHAMALMSLGINPYSGTEINYIQKIVDAFDGTQIGDSSFDSDDIFALIVLQNAGYRENDEIISQDIKYLLDPSVQPPDGNWGSIDMTAALIQALKPFDGLDGVSDAISKAEQYLKNSQQANGGFGNSFTTSWVLQAIKVLGEDSSDSTWTKNNLNPNDYLFTLQQTDGGIESLASDENTRIWATSYVIPAVMNKSWGDIMDIFSKPETEENNSPRQDLSRTSSSNLLAEKEEKDITQNDLVEVSQINKVVLPEIKKVSNPKVVVKDTTPEKKTVDTPELSNNVDLDNNLLASAGSVNLGNFFKDKVIMMTIILTLVTFIGGWFVIKS